MRVRVRHEVMHRLEPGMRTAIASIRITPRNHFGQYVHRWSLDVQPDCRLYPQEDAFGNLAHTFSVESPGEEIILTAAGEVDTQDTTGIVRGTVERFPPSLFLRPTPLTELSPDITAFADLVRAEAKDELGRLHALMNAINEAVEETKRPLEVPALAAAEVWEAKAGCPGGLTHLFTAAAHHLGIPARHVSGYVADEEGTGEAREWAEAHVPKIGWIAFDCGRSLCATEAYVRLAVGLDSLGVSVLKGVGVNVSETVSACDARCPSKDRQGQSQRQQ